MTKQQPATTDTAIKSTWRVAPTMPQVIGTASLLAAGCCAWWLRWSTHAPGVSPLRALGMVVVGAYLVASVLLLLEDR